jgi:arabinan endo-1,5-alpha-L-arabinosidase
MKPTGAIRRIAKRENGIEAPNLVYANGWYYLFVSIDKCCQGVNSTYKIAVGRSKEIAGPYVDKTGAPLLEGGGTLLEVGGERWKGPGGQDVYHNGDGWIMARHSYDAQNHGRPALRISDLYWDADRWPTLQKPASLPPAS